MKKITCVALLMLLVGFTAPLSVVSGQRLTLTAKESSHQFAFNESQTPVWAYNDKIPGPIIRVKEGQSLDVEFVNKLKEPSSIHWHGLIIDNAMDGVPGVTQDPVKTGEKFIYRLTFHDAGTYWYHPHLNGSEQLERGLKGALIVEPKEKGLDVAARQAYSHSASVGRR